MKKRTRAVSEGYPVSRRTMLSGGGAVLAGGGMATRLAAASADPEPLNTLDIIHTQLVMNLVVTCSSPERIGPSAASKDGNRDEIWPIIGGRFWGRGIRGLVVPGGGDFPVVRPDGAIIIDALYRLKTDDGVTIIIHNRGLAYSDTKYRLIPEFIAPVGKYDWLNKSVFIATLVEVPASLALAKGKNENDRLIQVHQIS
ncbi:DUF3237 domain-containing protein [Sphingobium sp. HBC34]|uniref:DUF3237 domain-containing protein n=1 Tax=Sphingobium cyanobacteriorum TaxID=3063954 RepID=A0ABT8ZM34_9SPHN|nr:DUF3237 domain-containing protein [Sphingobium sp. HBC34]MDO7835443.1 DUF3237 domain-containing protein [Sphingobium sp. HBC34]